MNELLKIKNDESQVGYFFLMGNSRSGHNFIKKNIQSWTNDLDESVRQYVNLENPVFGDLTNIIDDYLVKESIGVLNIRSLLNWYTSFFYFLHHWEKSPDKPLHKRIFVKTSDVIKNPQLLRNPDVVILSEGQTKEDFLYNIKSSEFNTKKLDKLLNYQLNIWLSVAKEFAGNTNLFPEITKVYYDEFFLSREYRKEICNKIGGIYNEIKLNEIPGSGRYSTFDKDKFQNKAQKMSVLKRWKNFKPEHHKYLKILKEHEALDFYLKNFDVPEEEKTFIDKI